LRVVIVALNGGALALQLARDCDGLFSSILPLPGADRIVAGAGVAVLTLQPPATGGTPCNFKQQRSQHP